VAVIFFLLRIKSAVDATNSLIKTLILHAIPAGALTAIAATLTFVLFKAFPQTNVNYLFSFLMGRLYTQALLNTLNLRTHLRSQQTAVSQYTFRSAGQVNLKDNVSFPGRPIALDKISVSHERSQQVEIGQDEKLAMDRRFEVDGHSV
jgi:hypothetical protein